MSIRASKLYGLDIYDGEGQYLGKVHDLILNMETGEVVRVTTEPLKANLSKEDLPKVLQRKSVLYKRVRAVSDIMIVGRGAPGE